MSPNNEKIKKLRALSEAQFREEVLIPLLKKMHFSNIRHRHGAQEFGKDITFEMNTQIGTQYVSIVVKTGNISGAADGKGNLNNTMHTIRNQIQESFDVKIKDVTDVTSPIRKIDTVIVWTTGTISNKAQELILSNLDTNLRSVQFYDLDKTIELIEKYYPTYFTIGDETIATYYENAKKEYSSIDNVYLGNKGGHPKQLDSIFVSPNLEYLPKNGKVRGKKNPNSLKSRKEHSIIDLMKVKSNILIIGDMGCGKSTLLRKLLLKTISNNEKNYLKYPIPVIVRFIDIELNEESPLQLDNEKVLEKAISIQLTRLTCQDYSVETTVENLKEGKILILLDGLDELSTEVEMKKAIEILKTFVQHYKNSGTRIIITSRITEIIHTTKLPHFRVYRVNTLTIKQIKRLIDNWFGGNNVESRKLISIVTRPVTTSMILATPLTLTLMAVLYENGEKELPANITELFQKYTELALGRWDSERNISSQTDFPITRFFVRKLSWKIMLSVNQSISLSEMEEIAKSLQQNHSLENVPFETLIDKLISRSNLLKASSDGNYEFKHRSFLEYFVGDEILNNKNSVEIISNNFLNPEWSNSIFFATGLKKEGDSFLEAILNIESDNIENYLHYSYSLGLVAQASYLSTYDIKRQSVIVALKSFVNAWDQLVKSIRDNIESDNDDEEPIIPHLYLVLFFTFMVSNSLGSKMLTSIIEKLAYEMIDETSKSDLDVVNEWIAYFMMAACYGAEDAQTFTLILENRLIKNEGLLYIIANILCERMSQLEDIPPELRKKIITLSKKLNQRINKNDEYMRHLISLPPLFISESIDRTE